MNSEKLKMPELRFREFRDNYTSTKLGNIVKASQGLQIAISNRFTEPSKDRVFYITIPFTQGNKIEYIENPKKSVLCGENDILVVRTGSGVGKILRGFSGAFHNNFFKLNTKESLNDNYLFFFLHKPKTKFLMNTYAGNSAIPDLNHGDFYSININIPENVKEQEKIASFLNQVDIKIEQLSKKEKLLEQYKKGIMQKIFNQEIRFSNDDENKFPDWEEKKLREFLLERVEYPEKEVPLYSLTIEEGVVPKSERYVREFLVKSDYEYKIVKENDFAYNPMNLRFGALARYKDSFDVMVSKYYNVFSCNESLNCIFAEAYFTNYKSIQYYNKMATGSLEEKKRVHFKDFLNFKFKFPCLEEQTKIANFLSSIDKKIEQNQKILEQTKQFKKALLQQMFV